MSDLTITNMRATLSSIRRMMGREWMYEINQGFSRQLSKDHMMYNRFIPHRLNKIIGSPSMVFTHKKIDYSVRVEIGNEWGEIKIKFPQDIGVEFLDVESAVKKIKEKLGEKDGHFKL